MPEDQGLDDITERQVQRVPETQQFEKGSQHSKKRSAHVLFTCSQGVSPGPGCRHDLISAHCWLRTDLRSSGDQPTEESWELSAAVPTFLSFSLSAGLITGFQVWCLCARFWISSPQRLPSSFDLCLAKPSWSVLKAAPTGLLPQLLSHYLLFYSVERQTQIRPEQGLSLASVFWNFPCLGNSAFKSPSVYSPLAPKKRAHTGEAHPYSESHPVMLIRVSVCFS